MFNRLKRWVLSLFGIKQDGTIPVIKFRVISIERRYHGRGLGGGNTISINVIENGAKVVYHYKSNSLIPPPFKDEHLYYAFTSVQANRHFYEFLQLYETLLGIGDVPLTTVTGVKSLYDFFTDKKNIYHGQLKLKTVSRVTYTWKF